MDTKFCIALGVSADWGIICNWFLRLFDVALRDIALSRSQIDCMVETLDAVFIEGGVLQKIMQGASGAAVAAAASGAAAEPLPSVGAQGEAPGFITTKAMANLRRKYVFLLGGQTVLLRGEPRDAHKAELLERVQNAAMLTKERLLADFRASDLRSKLAMWLSSSNQKVKLRRKRILELLAVVNREAWRAPNPDKFATGIPHFLSCDKRKGKNFGVARAFATQKVHFFLGKLQTKLTGECVGSGRFFCEAFPNLEPASGGSPRVEAIDCHRPAWWGKLRDTWGVKTLHDFFLKHIWNKHDGEARPLRKKWAPTALDVDVCNPAFWSSQFMAEDETQQWLAARGKTPVLSRCNQAASGAFRCAIRAGPAVALAQMYYYGEPMCTAFDVYKPFHRPADPHPQGELSGKEEERSAASWCGVATCPWWSSSSPSSSPLSSSSASQSSSPSSSPSSVIAIASRHHRQRSVVVILIPNGRPPHHRRRHRRR